MRYILFQALKILSGTLLLCILAGCGSLGVGNPAPPAIDTTTQYPPPTAKLVLNDPLKDNSRGYKWDETTLGSASCGFAGGAYHVKAEAQGAIICNPEARELVFGDVVYEINLRVLQGEVAGIIFHNNQADASGYVFFINTRQGTYSLSAENGNSTPFRPIRTDTSSAIHKGQQPTNLLAVIVSGSTFSLYVNHHLLTNVSDPAYGRGQIGIFTTDTQSPADIVASNARVWTLSAAV